MYLYATSCINGISRIKIAMALDLNLNFSSPCCLKPKKSEFDGISDKDLEKLIRAEVKFRKIETQKRIDAGLEKNVFRT